MVAENIEHDQSIIKDNLYYNMRELIELPVNTRKLTSEVKQFIVE